MNRKSLWIVFLALGMTYVAGCGGSGSSTPPNVFVSFSQLPPGILAPGGMASVAANVIGSSNNGVTWSCLPANACGSFSTSPTPSGTSTTYTAPGNTGSVTIIATSVANNADSASLNVNISSAAGLSGTYSFYLGGWDGQASNVYSLAGSVLIASNGSLTGEQDYNDGSGLTSPEPGGDMITSGSLWINPANGQGFLTLITNNSNLGINGTETLGLNFVNSNHALIIQADGSATSSGSFDLQTLPSTPAGGYSFAVGGAGSTGNTVFFGGVFSVSGTNLTNGVFDENHAGSISTNNDFTGTLSASDSFGRGTLTGTGWANTIAYYIVGPEAIRLIDVDTKGTFVGSAFGQGAGNFNVGSTNSVFSVQSNLAGPLYSAIGAISPVGGNFMGVADVNELNVGSGDAVNISGTFSVAGNGYGNLKITSQNLGDVSSFGIYAIDPNVNISDPNNTASGGGGALMVDLDNNVAGIGVLVPQTDPAAASFSGNYALGLQDLTTSGEFDFVGNATATASTLTGSGTVSDPGELLAAQPIDTASTFTSTINVDQTNMGRYLLDPFTLIVGDGAATINYQAVIYQASGGQLFWIENGADGNGSVFSGQIQQQTLPVPLFVKPAVVNKTQQH